MIWLIGGIALVVFLPVVIVWSTYNGLISDKNRCLEAWSGIYVQLERRASLIPNLVTVVKGYMQHERETLHELTAFRTDFLRQKSSDIGWIAGKANALDMAMGKVLALVENYPQLRVSENFLKLQEELAETEDQIAAAQRIYNSNVERYISAMESFPGSLVASQFEFKSLPFFRESEMLDPGHMNRVLEPPKVVFESANSNKLLEG